MPPRRCHRLNVRRRTRNEPTHRCQHATTAVVPLSFDTSGLIAFHFISTGHALDHLQELALLTVAIRFRFFLFQSRPTGHPSHFLHPLQTRMLHVPYAEPESFTMSHHTVDASFSMNWDRLGQSTHALILGLPGMGIAGRLAPCLLTPPIRLRTQRLPLPRRLGRQSISGSLMAGHPIMLIPPTSEVSALVCVSTAS